MSHASGPLPVFRAPALACDAHFHVFGPVEHYPYGTGAERPRYALPIAPWSDYLDLARHLGIERFVFVQPSAYGRDNSCMLDAMREVGTHCRGIVDIDEDVPDAELADLHRLGVRGIRINVSPVKQPQPGFGATLRPRIERLDARCAELGWHLDLLAPGWLTDEVLPLFARLRSPFSLAHMGMFRAEAGPEQPGFRKLIDLMRHGDGRCWVKLTGAYRMATAPDFADAAPMARALIAAAPHRLIWGSDYPHLSFADKVGSTQLFNLLGDWADAPTRQRILVDNPAALFGL